MNCRPNYKGLDALTRAECQRVIDEARLSRTDADIAEMYFIDRMAQADIAAVVEMTRSTISHRLTDIAARLAYTASRLQLNRIGVGILTAEADKANDALADLIVRMRHDGAFLAAVGALA